MRPTFEQVNEHLRLDETTGNLYWRFSAKARIMGKPVGTRDRRGYLSVSLLGTRYRGVHIIWLLHTGQWPEQEIDHINRDTRDDRPINLRDISKSENNYNRQDKNNVGVCGIFRVKSGKYRAMIGRKLLGFYETIEEAIEVRLKAEELKFPKEKPDAHTRRTSK